MFKHILTQVVVYETLLLKQRKELHALVGEAIEELYAQRLEQQYERLAFHYGNSNDIQKALYYLEVAGDKASQYHSLVEARKHYETALSFLDPKDKRPESQKRYVDLTLKWAEVSQYAPSDKNMEALKLSLTDARDLEDEERLADVSYWVGRFSYMQGNFSDVLPQVERCIKLAKRLNSQELLALSYNLMGRSCLYTDEHVKGLKYLEQGLSMIKPLEKWDEFAYSSAIFGLMLGLTGNFKKSLNTIRHAIDVAKDHGVLTFEAMTLGYLGTVQFWYGHWHEAVSNCSKCIDISNRLGNPLPMSWASLFKGAATYNLGDQQKGLSLMREGIHIITKTDSVLALRYYYSLLAEFLALSGNCTESRSVVQNALDLGQFGQKWGEIINHRTFALLAAVETPPDWAQVDSHMTKA
ncbi:MAG: hypothetical protein GTO24_01080, partial [candidate division Zixibacteria bacterium]|nr:hypothetical protein [candidate division Zixibacteria bacterium]